MNVETENQDALTIENSMDLLIVLLYAPGKKSKEAEPIEGITRLQKLMFLLQQDVGPKRLVEEAEKYDYEAFKMGPYSKGLLNDIEELKAAGIIETKKLEYLLTDDGDELPDDSDELPDSDRDIDIPQSKTKRVESYQFKLSRLGKDIGSDLWEVLPHKQRKDLEKFKSFFNSLTLRQLLIFTYEKYPEYTTKSEIKGQLGLV